MGDETASDDTGRNDEFPKAPAAARELLSFWFEETDPELWFAKNDDFDAACRARFAALYERAANGELADWEETPEGCVALVIALDQLPRNIHRGDARAFATDPAARAVLRRALERGFDRGLPWRWRQFLYMPLQHSEDIADQTLSVALNATLGDEEVLKFARAHRDIIERFGRFPHRNATLGRETTAEEAAFLEQPGSSF